MRFYLKKKNPKLKLKKKQQQQVIYKFLEAATAAPPKLGWSPNMSNGKPMERERETGCCSCTKRVCIGNLLKMGQRLCPFVRAQNIFRKWILVFDVGPLFIF